MLPDAFVTYVPDRTQTVQMSLEYNKDLVYRYLELTPPSEAGEKRALNIAFTVPSEAVGQVLRAELERMGYSRITLERVRHFVFKKWLLAGLSPAIECSAPAILEWLDSLVALAHSYKASLAGWAPTE